MFFWFIGTAVAAIWIIYRDPSFNYRALIAGALFPDLAEMWLGHGGPLHSVVTSAAMLAVVMLATIGRRSQRKALLAAIMGIFMHLVFDGAFLNTKMFWWPLGGLSFSDSALPSFERAWINLPLEVVGVLLILWWARERKLSKQVY